MQQSLANYNIRFLCVCASVCQWLLDCHDQLNAVYTLIPCFCNIHFNIIHFMPRFPRYTFTSAFPKSLYAFLGGFGDLVSGQVLELWLSGLQPPHPHSHRT